MTRKLPPVVSEVRNGQIYLYLQGGSIRGDCAMLGQGRNPKKGDLYSILYHFSGADTWRGGLSHGTKTEMRKAAVAWLRERAREQALKGAPVKKRRNPAYSVSFLVLNGHAHRMNVDADSPEAAARKVLAAFGATGGTSGSVRVQGPEGVRNFTAGRASRSAPWSLLTENPRKLRPLNARPTSFKYRDTGALAAYIRKHGPDLDGDGESLKVYEAVSEQMPNRDVPDLKVVKTQKSELGTYTYTVRIASFPGVKPYIRVGGQRRRLNSGTGNQFIDRVLEEAKPSKSEDPFGRRAKSVLRRGLFPLGTAPTKVAGLGVGFLVGAPTGPLGMAGGSAIGFGVVEGLDRLTRENPRRNPSGHRTWAKPGDRSTWYGVRDDDRNKPAKRKKYAAAGPRAYYAKQKPVLFKKLSPPSQTLSDIRTALNAASRQVFGRGDIRTIANAVRTPRDLGMGVDPHWVAFIFTENGNLSQYDNGKFWRIAKEHLKAAGYGTESINSGVIAVHRS